MRVYLISVHKMAPDVIYQRASKAIDTSVQYKNFPPADIKSHLGSGSTVHPDKYVESLQTSKR